MQIRMHYFCVGRRRWHGIHRSVVEGRLVH